MIVKNKKEILDRSNKLSGKYINLIDKEIRKFIKDDDPSSHIYFSVYCISMALSKVSLGIERFCQIYGIESLDSHKIINWVSEVSKEIVNENSKNVY